jgi:hypothetical protein
MPTIEHIKRREAQAAIRIQAAMGRLEAVTGVASTQMPTGYKNLPVRNAMRLEAQADYLEALADKLAPVADETEGGDPIRTAEEARAYYESRSKKELDQDLAQLGVDTSAMKLKSERVDAMMAAHGFTEEEQAATDGVPFTDTSTPATGEPDGEDEGGEDDEDDLEGPLFGDDSLRPGLGEGDVESRPPIHGRGVLGQGGDATNPPNVPGEDTPSGPKEG